MGWTKSLSTALRALSPLVNPGGRPEPAALRAAVAGKRVLITGASYGLGEATARALARAGAEVLLVARSADQLEAVAAAIRADGGAAQAYPADLTDIAAVEALAGRILERHGHVDVVVNNAGKSIRRSIALSADRFRDFERTIGVNYLGPVRLLLALLPSMRARRQGHIINVSTVGARLPPAPRWAAYQASKGAFDTWLRSVATEVRGDGIATTSIYMALVYTRMSAPTPIFRHLPGQTPDQAAGLIERAIVDRPHAISPWWLTPASLVRALPRGAVESALGAIFRLTGDTASAGARPRARRARAGDAAGNARFAAQTVRALVRARVVAPVRPDRLARMLAAARAGASPATACAVAAARTPDHPAIIDDRGAITYRELDRRVVALSAALHARGVGPERGLALMCRNHRGFVEALLAAARLGADVVLLNTEFPGPQLADALTGHGVAAAVFDQEFAPAFELARFGGARIIAWRDAGHDEVAPGAMADTLDALVTAGAPPPPASRRRGRIIILTSGTTGRPKGAPRTPSLRALLGPMTTLLSTIPFRAGDPILIAPPLFHGFGLSFLAMTLFLGSTLVVGRRFDAASTLAAIAEHRVATVVAVPVMLKRVLDAATAGGAARADTSSLRAALSAGAALPGALAIDFMNAFGDVVYNLYGSTETGFGAIATPADLRAAPGTIGRPPLGTTVRVLDDAGAEVATCSRGTLYLGSALVFDGYSGGGSKPMIGGLMSTGDVGHVDGDGRLFIDGRADDMIVSGGENVFPQEVEELIAAHAGVAEVAVIGVPDEEFGQRLRAFVVVKRGADASADDLKAYVRAHVARYKVPREVVFLDTLPRNPMGKVVRARLRDA